MNTAIVIRNRAARRPCRLAEPRSVQKANSCQFGGKRNPDGRGFAAFGKVVKGMDVVEKIQSSPAEGQSLSPPVKIQRAVRLN